MEGVELTVINIPRHERRRLMNSTWVHKTYRPRHGAQSTALQRFQNALSDGTLTQVEVNCPICDCSNYELIATRDRVGLQVDTVLCSFCPTMYSRKRLDNRSLSVFYSDHYRPMYGGIEHPEEDWFWQQAKIGEPILEWLTKQGLLQHSLDGAIVVEIGAGAGGLLEPFRQRGARTIGIDYDVRYLALGRKMGIEMISGGADSLEQLGSVDVVILKDVLEHLENLHSVLDQVRNCLNPNGFCFIQVPGLQSLKSLGYQNDLLRYLQFAHVVHFTEESLRYLVEAVGLEVEVATKQIRMVCRVGQLKSAADDLICPPNTAAVVALQHIFKTRRVLAVVDMLRPLVPLGLRKALQKAIRWGLSRSMP